MFESGTEVRRRSDRRCEEHDTSVAGLESHSPHPSPVNAMDDGDTVQLFCHPNRRPLRTTDVQTPNHRSARRRPLAVVVLLPLLFAACGGGDDGEATAPTAAETTSTVEISLLAFKPETFTVDAGAEVSWKQNDIGAHTVTSGTIEQSSGGVTQQADGRFDSGEIPKGETFEFTFTEAGTYPYFCRLHPATMRGEILVR